MAGYTRNDTSNNIATGNVINAADLDGEFDALVAAFHASTGHTHDGTAANGAPITKIGPAQDLVISTGAITPKTDNTVDLGSSSFEFKDLYIDGTANIDALVADTADINAGTIDGVTLGTNSAVTEAQIDNININGNTISSTNTNGNINLVPNGTGDVILTADTIQIGDSNTDVTVTTNGTGDLIFNTNAGTNSGVIRIYDGANGNIALTPNGTGEVDISKVDIDGGAIDGTTIGGSTAAAGSFTTLTTSSTVTLNGGTANGVLYLNGSKVATSGSALTFDGANNFLLNASAVSSQANFRVQTDTTGAVANAFFNINGTDYFRIYTTNGETGLRNLQNTSMYFSINNAEQMRLTSTGLGIGTSSPAYKLDLTSSHDGYARQWLSAVSFVSSADAVNGFQLRNLGSGTQGIKFANFANTVEWMRLDASGNLGLGVTPSAWGSTYRIAFQVGSGASLAGAVGSPSYFSLMGNAFLNNSAQYNYIDTAVGANRFEASAGEFRWFTAGAGSNPIPFTQAMTLDASGNLGVGETSPSVRLHAANSVAAPSASAGAIAYFDNTNTTSTADTRLVLRSRQTDSGVRERAMLVAEQSGTSGGNLSFWTRPDGNTITERARITSGGDLLVGTTSTIASARMSVVGNVNDMLVRLRNENTTAPSGLDVHYSGAATNNTANWFYLGRDSGANRFYVYSNGGIANYQANDVNLSDRREKTNLAPAKSYLDTICAIPVQTFNYIDQSEDDPGLTLGVVAQDVQAVAPELVMESNWGTEENPKMRLSIYQTDLQYALMKCIQEQQALITSLTARVSTLEGTQP